MYEINYYKVSLGIPYKMFSKLKLTWKTPPLAYLCCNSSVQNNRNYYFQSKY